MSDTAPITIEQRLEELEKFRDFAQPIVINCGRLWDRTHEREGLKDYFKTETHHAQPLIELGNAIDDDSCVGRSVIASLHARSHHIMSVHREVTHSRREHSIVMFPRFVIHSGLPGLCNTLLHALNFLCQPLRAYSVPAVLDRTQKR